MGFATFWRGFDTRTIGHAAAEGLHRVSFRQPIVNRDAHQIISFNVYILYYIYIIIDYKY